jgi:hypothetical protein
VTRPPVISAQNRSISEAAVGGTLIQPPLSASQPQSLPFNFSVSPSAIFGIQPTTGVLFLQPGASLVYRIQSTYLVTVSAATASGAIASAPLTLLVTEVNKPPAFTSPTFISAVNETSPAGTAILTLTATSLNVVDSLTYSIVAVNVSGLFHAFCYSSLSHSTSLCSSSPCFYSPLVLRLGLRWARRRAR